MAEVPDSIVFRSIRQIDPNQPSDAKRDLTLRGGEIWPTDQPIEPTGLEQDAEGWIAAPAFVDLRAQFFEPGLEYREGFASGLAAAAAGGFAWVCGLPTSDPPADCAALLSAVKARADTAFGARLLPLGALTRQLAGRELADIGDLAAAGAVAVTDVHTSQANSQLMRRAFEYAATFQLPVFQHPGDPALERGAIAHEGPIAERLGLTGLPASSESIGLARDLELVRLTGVRYHASVLTTADAVDLIRNAKDEGLRVTADVAAHSLLLTDERLVGYDSSVRLDPPLRDERHRRALVQGLNDGVIDAIVSDHTPLAATEKDCEFDQACPGASSLETTLSVIAELVSRGEMEWLTALRALSTGPCRVLGLEPFGLTCNRPATIVVFNPAETWQLTDQERVSKGANSPFHGQTLRGRVQWTFQNGRAIFTRLAKAG